MRSSYFTGIILTLSIAFYILLFPSFEGMRNDVKRTHIKGLTLPPIIVKLMALEFRSIAADLFFIRVSQFYGGKIQRMEEATKEDWDWLYHNLMLTTDLDPYFQDPYYLGNAFLAWNAGMIDEANTLLMRGSEKRYWDWNFPFYIGFNKFYFKGDNQGGAEYILKSYARPGAWKGLPTLAARLYYAERKTEAAIAFLIKFYENETDTATRKWLKLRLDALQGIFLLEKAVENYRYKIGVSPKSINDLIKEGIIDEIPEDPYGGIFYIDKDGSIKTTSKMSPKNAMTVREKKFDNVFGKILLELHFPHVFWLQ